MALIVSGAQPGAKKFAEVLIVIIIIVLIALFLNYTSGLEKDIEKVAIEIKVNDINATLAVSLYKYTIDGKLNDLAYFHRDNPFVFLAINKQPMVNYFGTIQNNSEIKEAGGWYFNVNSREVIYNPKHVEDLVVYSLEFNYIDNNKSAFFEAEFDSINYFSMVKKPPLVFK